MSLQFTRTHFILIFTTFDGVNYFYMLLTYTSRYSCDIDFILKFILRTEVHRADKLLFIMDCNPKDSISILISIQ